MLHGTFEPTSFQRQQTWMGYRQRPHPLLTCLPFPSALLNRIALEIDVKANCEVAEGNKYRGTEESEETVSGSCSEERNWER